MIPKRIHYIWLSNEKKTKLIQKCIDSWKKVMPDYEIKCWNMHNIPQHHWIEEAISVNKWALASDYIRLYALNNEGGVYLDTDVYVQKKFDTFLEYNFFTAIEYNEKKFIDTASNTLLKEDGSKISEDAIIQGLTIQAAIIGSAQNNDILLKAMQYYDTNHFIDKNGGKNYTYLAPDVLAMALESYGFKYRNTYQNLGNNAVIYPTDVFASGLKVKTTDGGGGVCHTPLCFIMERLFVSWKNNLEDKNNCKNDSFKYKKTGIKYDDAYNRFSA
jgi:hypothetical protein